MSPGNAGLGPGNRFFAENETTILQSTLTGIMDISVDGVEEGEALQRNLSYRFTDGPNHAHQKALYTAYGTTLVYVALPAVAGAKMVVNGQTPAGVISPDSREPAQFFAYMAERGVPFKFDEKTTQHTVIKS